MWFYLALANSFFSAVSVVLTKKLLQHVSATLLTWIVLVLATPIIFLYVLKEGFPVVGGLFYIGIIGSVLFYTSGKLIQYRAIRQTSLSEVYPLVALGPIVTLGIAALPPLREQPQTLAIVGVIITLAGCYLLNFQSWRRGLLEPFRQLFINVPARLMLVAILLDSVVTVFDKIAITHTLPISAVFVLLVENILTIILLIPVLRIRETAILRTLRAHWHLLLALGLLEALTTILGFTAIGGGDVALVLTLFRIKILFVLVFGYLFLGDKPKKQTVIGSLVMVVGVVVIKLFS
jgi:transporter family protein